MTFGDLSLNGTVHVIPSLLEETSTDPPSVMTDLKTTVDDSVNVAMGELEKKIEDLEKENEDLKKEKELRGHSHITSALFGVSGHPWWCCKQWSAFALTLGTYTLMT